MATRKTADAAPAVKTPAFKIPKTIGACADLLYTTREARLALDRQSAALEEQEKALREHIINTLPKSDASGVAGKLARVSVLTDDVPRVNDWDKFYAFIKRTGSFHLLTKAIKKDSVEELLENRKGGVPGVEKFQIVKVSLNKV
jgi:hypothetical protein